VFTKVIWAYGECITMFLGRRSRWCFSGGSRCARQCWRE